MSSAHLRQISIALERFNKSALAKSAKTVDALAVSVKYEIQQELSHPGKGKPRRIGNFNQAQQGPLLPGQKRRYYVPGTRKRKDKERNFHRPSLRGDPPAPDTNTLKRSAFVERAGRLKRLVGVATNYARALEEKMNRPFMYAALRRAIARLKIPE